VNVSIVNVNRFVVNVNVYGSMPPKSKSLSRFALRGYAGHVGIEKTRELMKKKGRRPKGQSPDLGIGAAAAGPPGSAQRKARGTFFI
jgi:hypothetical protein